MMENFTGIDVKLQHKINILPKYWNSLKPQNNVCTTVEESWKKRMEFMDEISVQNNVVVFLWNAFTNRFLYMSDKIQVLSYYDPAMFTSENGVAYLLSLIHPAHLDGALLLIRELIVNYCATHNKPNFKNVKISLNYLFKNGVGEYLQILHRPVILEVDENNKPTLVLNITHHVDHIKKEDSIGGIVVTEEDNFIFDYNLEQRQLESPKSFSDQEMKILQLLGKGLDTRAIAEKLFISPHTVDTHRRNIIKKTSCMDTTGVVAYAKFVGLI
jgi:DNA-binding CsgD family transcriptional regulator